MPHDFCTEVNYRNTEAGGIPSLPRTEPGIITLQISVSAAASPPAAGKRAPCTRLLYRPTANRTSFPALPFLPSFPFASRQLLEA